MFIIRELSEKIIKYLDERKFRTLNILAKEADVRYTTLRRIATCEVGTTSIDTAIKILRIIDEPSNIAKFCSHHFGDLGKIMSEFYEKGKNKEFASLKLDNVIKDYSLWITLCLAENSDGLYPHILPKLA